MRPTDRSRSLPLLAIPLALLVGLAAPGWALPVVQNVFPANGAVDVSPDPILELTCLAPDIDWAQFQIATNASFANLVFDSGQDPNYTCSIVALAGLDRGQTYYWRGRVREGSQTSNWSNATSFTTLSPSETLEIYSFRNGQGGYSGTQDADIRGNAKNPALAVREWNQGAAPYMRTGRRPAGSDTDEFYRTLMRFALDSVPRNLAVLNAWVEIIGEGNHSDPTLFDAPRSFYPLLRPWNEGNSECCENAIPGEVNWLNSILPEKWDVPGADGIGTDREAMPVLRGTFTNDDGYVHQFGSVGFVDVVQEWVADPSRNQGFVLRADDEQIQRVLNLRTSEDPTISRRPRIVIEGVLVPPADLRVAQSASVASASPGDPVDFTITVRNDGPEDATGVELAIPVPPQLTFLGANPDRGSFDANTGVWTVGNVADNASFDLDLFFTVKSDADGELIVSAAEVTGVDQPDTDSFPGNGLAGEDDRAVASIVVTGGFSTGFDGGAMGFTYADDAFRGTNEPFYADGNHRATGGFSGGGLEVAVGGVDDEDIFGMSGGWSTPFALENAGLVTVHLRYRITEPGSYEADECVDALVAIDGTLHGVGSNDHLQRICGRTPQTNVTQDTGWQTASIDVPLGAGVHTLTIGGFNDKKTLATELGLVFFDDVELVTTDPSLVFAASGLAFSAQHGGAAPPLQNVALATSDASSASYSVSSNQPWASASPAAGTAPRNLSVSVNPAGLPLGTHTATLTATAPGKLPDSLTVTLEIVEPSLVFSDTSLDFSAVAGGGGSSQSVDLMASSGGASGYTLSSDQPWATTTPTGGTTPDTISVSVNPALVGAGTHMATITASAPGLLSDTLLVTLEVAASSVDVGFDAGAEGFTYADDTFRGTSQPAYASGNYTATGGFTGGGLRVLVGGVNGDDILGMSGGWSTQFALENAGPVDVSLRYRLAEPGTYEADECVQALFAIDGMLYGNGPGDSLHQYCGSTPQTDSPRDTGWQQANFALDLASGVHTLTVGGFNDEKTLGNEFAEIFFDDIAVTPTTPGLAFAQNALSYTAEQGAASTPSQQVGLGTTDAGNTAYSVSSSQPWASAVPSSGTTPQMLSVHVDPSGLGLGTHTATLTASSPGYGSDALLVSIEIVEPSLVFGADSLGFAAVAGGAPSSQNVSLATSSNGSLGYTLTSNQPWAVATSGDGVTPDTVNVAVNPSLVGPGTHVATITASAPGLLADTLLVTLDVAANTVVADFDTGLDGFTYAADAFRGTNAPAYATGNHAPGGGFTGGGLRVAVGGVNGDDILGMSGGFSTQFALANAGAVNVSLRYRVADSGTYEADECVQALLAIDGTLHGVGANDFLHQICGNTPQNNAPQNTGWQSVSLDLALGAGVHTLTIGGFNNEKTLGDELGEVFFDDISVTPSTPALGFAQNSLSYTAEQGAASMPSQTVGLDTSDASAAGYTVVSNQSWASATPSSGTTPQTLTVHVDPSGLGLGTHSATLTATGAGLLADTLAVTVEIVEPSLVFSVETLDFAAEVGGSPSSRSVDIATSSGSAVAYSLGSNQPWASATKGTGTTPDAVSVEVDPGALGAGTHVAVITATAPGLLADAITVTVEVVDGSLAASFDGGADGFTYADDAFRGTTAPGYASGAYAPGGGFSGGGLRVDLGGIDKKTVTGISGAWSNQFFLAEPALVTISMRTRITSAGTFEADECIESLVAVDGNLIGVAPDEFLLRTCGVTPQTDVPTDTGWQLASVDVALASGVHTLEIGGFVDKKTNQVETASVFFDDVSVASSEPALFFGPASIEFGAEQGGTAVLSRDVTVDASDASARSFTISSNRVWASATPSAGTTAETVRIDVDPTALGVGTHTATLTASGAGIDAGALTVTVNVFANGVFEASFDAGSDGFAYADDLFRGTSAPGHAAGAFDASGGFVGGGLRVDLGGVDRNTVLGMSGGFTRDIQIAVAGNYEISFRTRMVFSGTYEGDECSQVLVAVDGGLEGVPPNDHRVELCGETPSANVDEDTGWVLGTAVVFLDAGTHTIAFGGYGDKKTYDDETTRIYVDDIVVSAQ